MKFIIFIVIFIFVFIFSRKISICINRFYYNYPLVRMLPDEQKRIGVNYIRVFALLMILICVLHYFSFFNYTVFLSN